MASEMRAVTMKDARVVNFGKRMKAKKEIISDTEVRFDFLTGDTLVFDSARCTPETIRALGLHGAKQKIGDEGSDEDSAESYLAKCRAMIGRLYDGTAFERQGGGGFADTVLIEALITASGKTDEEVRAELKTMSADEKLALRQLEQVAAAIKVVEAKRAEGVDKGAVAAKFGLGAKVEPTSEPDAEPDVPVAE